MCAVDFVNCSLALPLVDLDLTGFLFVTDDAILALKAAQHLQILSLTGTRLTDIGAAVFVHLSSLKELSLERTNITDKAIEYMRGMPYSFMRRRESMRGGHLVTY
jgi:hypothetical protein